MSDYNEQLRQVERQVLVLQTRQKLFERTVEKNEDGITVNKTMLAEHGANIRELSDRVKSMAEANNTGLFDQVIRLFETLFTAKNTRYIAVAALAVALLYFVLFQEGCGQLIDLAREFVPAQ